VDCWGVGFDGQLGNGTFYTSSPYGSATPVAVKGVGETGILTGVASLVRGDDLSYCALLTSGRVDCWGWGVEGELGNGTFYTDPGCENGEEPATCGSATPVAVGGVGGTGRLTEVTNLVSDDGEGNCALLTSGGVDCWGAGEHWVDFTTATLALASEGDL
jgi:alpha-tubulin suppressor-like RCC1 family protein